jgi:hypothetical protein
LDPENHKFLMETNLPTPMTARVYVNLLVGNISRKYVMEIVILNGIQYGNIIEHLVELVAEYHGISDYYDY